MSKVGKKTTEKSKEIIKLVKKGKPFSYIVAKGYNRETTKYYVRKFNRPEKHIEFVQTITILNRKRRLLNKVK
jgi:hypothetical protein